MHKRTKCCPEGSGSIEDLAECIRKDSSAISHMYRKAETEGETEAIQAIALQVTKETAVCGGQQFKCPSWHQDRRKEKRSHSSHCVKCNEGNGGARWITIQISILAPKKRDSGQWESAMTKRALLNDMRKLLATAMMFLVLFETGCGTIATKRDPLASCRFEGKRTSPVFIFSGTRCDAQLLIAPFHAAQMIWVLPFGVIDLPLSITADVLMLPWSIYQVSTN